MTKAAELEQLQNLFVDPDFQQLQRRAKVQRNSPFRILNVQRSETAWSNALAWLLSPDESHGYGDRFLRAFLTDAFRNSAPHNGLSPLGIQCLDFSEVEVFREYTLPSGRGRVDLLLRSESANILLLIENKIDSGEGADQTDRYQEAAHAMQRTDETIGLVYLTLPRASDPRCRAFVCYDYERVVKLVRALLDDPDTGTPEARNFLTFWVQTIEEILGMGEENLLRQTCHTLYQRHADAIELLVQYRPSFWGELDLLLPQRLSGFRSYTTANGWLAFWPATWKISGRTYADLYYIVFNWKDDRTRRDLLWVGLETKAGYWQNEKRPYHQQLRAKVDTVISGLAAKDAFQTNVDANWLVHWSTGMDMPKVNDPGGWQLAFARLLPAIENFLQTFPPDLFANTPGVCETP